MERKANFVKIVTALSICALLCPLAEAQAQRSGGRKAAPHHGRARAMKSTQERWRSLSPAARQSFRRNAERWIRMSPEQRNILRQRERLRRAQMKRNR